MALQEAPTQTNKEPTQIKNTPTTPQPINQPVARHPFFYGETLNRLNNFGMDFSKQFINFLQKYGVIGLAVGVVVGQAVNNLVQSLVNNIITPAINLMLRGNSGDNLKQLEFWGIKYGEFLNSTIQFVLLMLVIYIAIRYVINRILTDDERKKLNISAEQE